MSADQPGKGGLGRLAVFYVILAAIVAVVFVLVINAGTSKKAQPTIAGGYVVASANPCLGKAPVPIPGPPLPATAPGQPVTPGPAYNVAQSGQFVSISNAAGTLGGKLRLHPASVGGGHPLTGNVNCVNGKQLPINAVAVGGAKGTIAGTLGGIPFSSTLKTDPPAPGAAAPRVPVKIDGLYAASPRSTCFGGKFQLNDASGSTYTLVDNGTKLGTVAFYSKTGQVAGDVACVKGGRVRLRATANDRLLNNVQLLPLELAHPVAPVKAAAVGPAGAVVVTGKPVLTTATGLPPSGETFTATKTRTASSKLVAAFLLAAAIVIIVAYLFGLLAVRLGQPRVMGEVVAGICLGPSVLGAISSNLQASIFASDLLPAFGIAANIGLIFYMFLIGMDLDRSQLKGRLTQAAAISNASVALPLVLGFAVALPLYPILGPNKKFVAFALFMGVSMSITAFPVLARILAERRMLKKPVGALTVACAAIDDVTAWFLIALATTIAVSGTFGDVAKTIGEAIAFILIMALVVRPLLARVSIAFDEVGRIPGAWMVAIFALVLVSAYITETINIAVIFGGFIAGLVMPRNARLTREVTRRIEDFVLVLFLPMFFAYTGLQTNIGLLDRPELWLITLALIGIAIVGKLAGAAVAARVSGFDWRASAVIGTLMNTRGLTELIVLNLALQQGAISNALYAALVLMALVTTFMAAPILKLLDRDNRYGDSVEEAFDEAKERSRRDYPDLSVPERSVLVAPQTDAALPQLLALAKPLATSAPPREIVLARLVVPPRAAEVSGGLQLENAAVAHASAAVNEARSELVADGIAARAVALTSSSPGRDLSHLVEHEDVDLVLVEARRPLFGQGIALHEVNELLASAPSDVAVLIAREQDPIALGPDKPVLVVFGGAEHDWSALELGSWLASTTGAPLKLIGAGETTDGNASSSVSRMLADAGLLAQQFSGVATESVVVENGRQGIIDAAEGAGLLLIGLSERWQREGLGSTRSEIARAVQAPVLFVRRGTRPAALAPRENLTRFQWSMAGNGGDPEESMIPS